MFPEKLLEVLKHPGIVAIATQGDDGPHLVNSWNNYIQLPDDRRLVIPVGFMHKTEANIAKSNRVLLTIGSHEVQGKLGPGTGFLIKGTAAFSSSGPEFEAVKGRFAWARAALVVSVDSVEQTI